MELIREFKKISRNDAAIAGGKGASLGEMTQAGIPVPPGYVILSAAFEKFLDATDLNVEIDAILHTVKLQEMHTVEDASAQIQALILSAEMPREIALEIQKFYKELNAEFVAVRSSATAEDSAAAAWAGQLDSFLNTTEKTLLDNVRKCWASLFTPRAIFYRFEKNLHEQKISVAVVVQKMVASEVSGIAFSVHPVTQDYNQLIIESGFGLGEAIVSGQITPDSYVVEKAPRRIIDKNVSAQARGLYRAAGGGNEWRDLAPEIGERQVLTDEQIMELSEIILTIENHYGFPCDIEWAREGGKFYIVQSRPITTLQKNQTNLSAEFLRLIGDKKLYPPLNNYSAFIQGSGYNSKEYYGKWYDENFKLDFLLLMKEGFSQIWLSETDFKYASEYGFKEFINAPKKFEKRLKLAAENQAKTERLYDKYSYEKVQASSWPELKPLLDEIRRLLWESNAALFFCIYLDQDFCWKVLSDLKYEITKSELDAIWPRATQPAFKSFDKDQLEYLLTLINQGAAFSQIIEQCQFFLTDYHSAKSLAVIETMLKNNFSKYLKNKKVAAETLKAETENLQAIVKAHDEWRRTLAPKEKVIADYLQLIMKMRDQRKNFFAKGLTIIYRIAEKIFSEVGVSVDLIPYYTVKELKLGSDYLKNSIEKLEIRKNGFQLLIPYSAEVKMLEFPITKAVEEVNAYFVSSHSTEGDKNVLTGQAGFKGCVRGRVRIVLDVNADHGFEAGEILVAGMTRPEYVPLMKQAAGIVTDEGGITCHAAIMSRELGKPCVIGTKIATRVLKDGDLVEVDADNGVVKIIKKTAENNESKSGRIFLREHSREYSLFRLETLVWAMNQELQKILGISVAEECAVYRGADLVDIYYEKGALKKLFDGITQSCQDKSEMLKKIAQFLTNFNRLKKLYTGEESLKSVAELKNFQKQYAEVWSYFGILFIIPSLSVDEEIKKAALKARTLTQEYNENPEVVFTKFVEEKFPQVKGKSRFVLPEEIWSGEIESPDILMKIKDREKGFVYYKNEIFTGDVNNNLKRLGIILEDKDSMISGKAQVSENEIKGQSASSGKVEGLVKIVSSVKALTKVNRGDILVAAMTMPKYLPAMKKAAAFVTDEGGLTCHAAIIAREMKKPCVIGTKIATQILKDGDLVEVDADKGVVRKLN